MPDPRFFRTLAPVSLGELAILTGAALASTWPTARAVGRVDSLTFADANAVSFLAGRRHVREAGVTQAGACFVAADQTDQIPNSCAALVTSLPQAAFAVAANRLHQPVRHGQEFGAVHSSAEIEDGVTLGPGVVIGPGASIGRNTFVSAGAVIGPGVAIGRNCFIGARACIGFALIGDRVSIHAGAVIGEPGFGATLGPKGIIDIPQLGRVLIQDGVTIGSGACVDRGALGDTAIGENTKIDNLVQIAHNVTIGRNCVLAAHTGVSGSVTIGDGCQLGGRAGIADHVTIGAGARIAAAAGVMSNIPAGESWGGYPARPVKRWLRETAMLAKIARRRTDGGIEI